MKGLASDNQAGVIPEVMAAIVACNVEHAMPYGQDEFTSLAIEAIKSEFGDQVEASIGNSSCICTCVTSGKNSRKSDNILSVNSVSLPDPRGIAMARLMLT